MVRLPCKVSSFAFHDATSSDPNTSQGTTLLALVSRYPFLVSIIKSEVLLHRIEIDLLNPGDNADPSRPLFSHRPPFLSPLAFDYAHAKTRYPLGFSSNPYVENCYVNGYKPPGGAEDVSSTPWPPTPRRYTRKEKEVEIDLGQVTGKSMASYSRRPSKSEKGLADWAFDRDVGGGLPVAIALLVRLFFFLGVLVGALEGKS